MCIYMYIYIYVYVYTILADISELQVCIEDVQKQTCIYEYMNYADLSALRLYICVYICIYIYMYMYIIFADISESQVCIEDVQKQTCIYEYMNYADLSE